MKRTFEEKLNIISLFLDGLPQSQLCKQFRLGQHYLEDLIDRYNRYGEAGLRNKTHNRLSGQEKAAIVHEFLENGVTLRCIRNKYNVSRTALETWVSQVRTTGYGPLYKEQGRGRPPKDPMARPKKKEPQTEIEKLQAENLRLRAENALLKKVKALVEEQEARARLNGQKPSTN